jgi:hypothetical protein
MDNELKKIIEKNFLFHAIVENEVRSVPFGQITFSVMLQDGVAQIGTLTVIKTKRKRYRLTKEDRM